MPVIWYFLDSCFDDDDCDDYWKDDADDDVTRYYPLICKLLRRWTQGWCRDCCAVLISRVSIRFPSFPFSFILSSFMPSLSWDWLKETHLGLLRPAIFIFQHLNIFRCASISWIHVGEWVSGWVMFLRFCQFLGISSGYLQGMFRVCSEYVQSMFRVCSFHHLAHLVRQSNLCWLY